MRIRKRFPPSSQPLSDPQLNQSLLVQQHIQAHPYGNLCVQVGNTGSQSSDPPNQPLRPPSDQRLPPGNEKTRWVFFGARDEEKAKQKELEGGEVKDERWREEENSNDTRKGSILGAEIGVGVLQPSGSSYQVGRWCEGDKVVPLKKRRMSFERRMIDETIMDKEKKMNAKMKSKTNKKCRKQNGFEEGIENSGVKKTKRGSVIMEGSRCSRVNGRGWRCCQQTLVGYSLCEHHLGKGRLRSMTSVRSRTTTTTTATNASEKNERLSSAQEKKQGKVTLYENTDDEDNDDEQKPLMVTKKRMKLGMVKARSISSLLSQTNDTVLVADSNNKT